jgi:hypothetical protein
MANPDYFLSLPFPVTVCDPEGVIIAMNDAAAHNFTKDGGRTLIGKNILDCHNPDSREKIRRMMDERTANVYTSEKNGMKKLIYQAPWWSNGEYAGILEISIEVPNEIPNFLRE